MGRFKIHLRKACWLAVGLLASVSASAGGNATAANASAPANGDAERGRQLYANQCIACHSVEVNLAGPFHRGVFGRKAGSAPKYEYSVALRKAKFIWTERQLDKWLKNPSRLVPGSKMGYAVGSAQERADLIAYLATLTAADSTKR